MPRTEFDPTIGINNANVYDDVHAERAFAFNKFKDKPAGSMEQLSWDSPRWLPVLGEEVGEVSRAINEAILQEWTNLSFRGELRAELIQVAAMACAWIEAIDDWRSTHND